MAIAADAPTLAGATTVSAFQFGISATPVLAATVLTRGGALTSVCLIGAALAAAAIPFVLADKREEFDFRVKVAGLAQHMVETVTAYQTRALSVVSSLDTLLFVGGLAPNCVANTKMLERSSFTGMEVSFGASDHGVALGAAVHTAGLRNRPAEAAITPYLGPSYDEAQLLDALEEYTDRVTWQEQADSAATAARTAELLAEKNVVGWFQGRAEFGPRALGNRSILADPAFPDIKDVINLRVKHREPFRPFAPVVLASEAPRVFEMGKKVSSPCMTFVFLVRKEHHERMPGA